MKAKLSSCTLFFTIFYLFFFYSLTFLKAETIPDLWSTSIKTSRPTAVAVDIYENLYIAEAAKNHLLVYNSSGKYLKKIEGLNKPISAAVDNNGRIFIGNAGRSNVEVFDDNLTFLFKLGTGDGEFKQPTAIAVTGGGNIYVADGKEDKIKVYNSNGSNSFSFGSPGNGDDQFNYPTSLAIDEQVGEVIVCDLQVRSIESKLISAARIQIFDLGGNFIRSFGEFGVGEGLLVKPLGVDIDTEGRIYVADAYQNVVQVFDYNGNPLKMLYNSDNPLRTPLSIAIGKGTRRLFIASLNTASVEVYKVVGENDPPTADAGPDQTKDEGDAVTLDGSYSIDPDGSIACYLWEQTAGTPVELSDPNAAQPTFTAPDVGPGGEALSFQLTVTDNGGLPSTDTCIVNVTWIGQDTYEPDNDPNLILFDTSHMIIVNAPPTRHSFYCEIDQGCDDRDWVFFYAYKDNIYEIYAQDLSEYDYFIQLSLYDLTLNSDPNTGFCLIGNNTLSFQCPEDGYYLLEATLASSYAQGGVEYILSVYNPQAQDFTDILVHLVDQSDHGIEGLKVILTNPQRTFIEFGNGFYHIAQIGMSTGPSILEVSMNEEYLANLTIAQLEPYSMNETEFTLDQAAPNYPTVALFFHKGINLYYLPSIDESSLVTNPISAQIYIYDSSSNNWNEDTFLRSNNFNALYTSEAGMVYLDLTGLNHPILYLQGFLHPDYYQENTLFSISCLDKDLFDPNYFDPNESTREILHNQDLSKIEMIYGQSIEKASWEASYRFFGKIAGKNICLKPLETYVVIKGKGMGQ